jgi:hypothetical protein
VSSQSGGSASIGSPRIGTMLSLSGSGAGERGASASRAGQRPPSPRSMLANPRLASSAFGGEERGPELYPSNAPPPRAGANGSGGDGSSAVRRGALQLSLAAVSGHPSEDQEEEEEDKPVSGAFAHVRSPRGSGSRPGSARVSFDPGSSAVAAAAAAAGSSGGSTGGGGGGGAAAAQRPPPAAAGSGPRHMRGSVMRVKTPGVLLVPSASAAASAAPPPARCEERRSSGLAAAGAAPGCCVQQELSGQRAQPGFADSELDEILRLEPLEGDEAGAPAAAPGPQPAPLRVHAGLPAGRPAAAGPGAKLEPRTAGSRAPLAAAAAPAGEWDVDELEAELAAMSASLPQPRPGSGAQAPPAAPRRA